jgi:hypothetical protein
MYYRVPGFLAVERFGSPTLPLLPSANCHSSQSSYVSPIQLILRESGWGSKIIRWRESLVLYNPLVTTLCQGLQYEAVY